MARKGKLNVCQGTRTQITDTEQARHVIALDHNLPCKVILTDDSQVAFQTDLRTPLAFKLEWADRGGESFSEEVDNILSSKPPSETFEAIKEWLAGWMPKIDVKCKGIDFFKTTNLLLPGRKFIDIDEEASVKIPLALVMVGKVIEYGH